MTRAIESDPSALPSSPTDWVETFYTQGWRDRIPWVVVEQVWPSARRAEQFVQQTHGGWGFGLVSFRVLDAPMFDVFAPPAIAHAIVAAIREYPARRAALFEQIERRIYEAQGLPAAVIEEIAPRPDEPMSSAQLHSPVLLVTTQPGTRGLVLLGAPSTFDVILERLVAHGELTIDHALALMILLTCHGKPGDVAVETRDDGATMFRRGDRDSAFLTPFHPARFTQVNAALHGRTADESRDGRQAELHRLLASQMREVVESLRSTPPRKGSSVHAAARSRLVERASTALALARPTRPRTTCLPWYTILEAWPARDRRAFLLRSLTVAECRVVRAVLRGDRLPSRPSTPRVLLGRAKAKFDKALHDRRQSST